MKLSRLGWIPLLAFLLAGCVEVDQEVTLNKDGSAQIKAHFAMAQSVIDMMEAAKKQGGGEMKGGAQGDFPMTEEDVRKMFADQKDVKVSDVKVEEKDGKRHIYFTAESKTLATFLKAGQMGQMNLTKGEDGNYTLWTTQKPKPAKAKTDEELAMEKQMRAMMLPMLKGLKASIKFNLPTEIIETTAPEKTANSARWAFDVDKDPSFMDKEPEIRVKFKGQGLNLPEIKAPAPQAPEPPEDKPQDKPEEMK